MDIEKQILDRSAGIAVIGLGYVGLPLATGFATAGFPVQGIDINEDRVQQLARGESYIADVPSSVLAELRQANRFASTTSFDAIRSVDIVFICVPTPITDTKEADVSYIESAARSLAGRLTPGQLIVLQSTTYPGTTEELVLPILETTGMKAGVDFHLAFCPERINPGDQVHTVANMPKVVGGLTPRCTELARQLMAQLSPQVFIVSSPRTAEMAKLLENSFRNVNIALVNEMALLCERMGLNIWEVIAAASTKPFGYLPFYPSAGVGGHCIPVDPYYLSWKARSYDFYTKFIELAADLNQSMPYHVMDLVRRGLNDHSKAVRGSRVLVLGVAFKRDIDDARNSPAERVIELLLADGAAVSYNDPFVPVFTIGGDTLHPDRIELCSTPLDSALTAGPDCVLIIAAHSSYQWDSIVSNASLVVDTCNATAGCAIGRDKIVLLGSGRPS